MRSYQQTFGAGESKDFQIDAKFFFLFEALNAVTIQFWKGGAPSDDLALDVLAGFKVRPLKGFDRITITSSAAQTIKFFIATGEGDYERLLGSVQLIGDVALNAATLAALETINAFIQPESYSSSYKSTTALGANAPETVFTPAANVNGAIVHYASYSMALGANSSMTFGYIAKASAPVNILDGDVIPMIGNMAAGSAQIGNYSLDKSIRIPAGKGLYALTGIAEAVAFRSVLYTLL